MTFKTPVQPLTGAAAHGVYAGETPAAQIFAAAWASHRQAGKPAHEAIKAARAALDVGKVTFPAFHAANANPVCTVGGTRGRWYENPQAAGLRFVGMADDLASLNHSGWYLDENGEGELARGVVYQLPTRDGEMRFLAGYADPYNGEPGKGPAFLGEHVFREHIDGPLDAEATDLARDAARAADRMAESMAESEREYQMEWRAGMSLREAFGEVTDAAKSYVAAVRALRALLPHRHALPLAVRAEQVRAAVKRVRNACADLEDAREDRRNHEAFGNLRLSEAAAEGYRSA